LKLHLRRLELAGERGGQVAALIDFVDEASPRLRRARGGGAGSLGGPLEPGQFGPPLIEHLIGSPQPDEVLTVLLGTLPIQRGHGCYQPIRAAKFLQVGHTEEEARVAGTTQLVQLNDARLDERCYRAGGLF
jgi:hypothetical protein